MDGNRNKVVLQRFYRTFLIISLAIYLLLMIFVLPWWHVSNYPVQVTLGPGPVQKVELAYSPDEEPLPLVPIGESQGYQLSLGTELPPRPSYELALVFPEGTMGELVLKDIKIIRPDDVRETYSLAGGEVADPGDGSIYLRKTSSGYRIRADAGGILPVSIDLPSVSPFAWLTIWFRASVGFLVVCLVIFFTLVTFFRFPDTVQAFRKKTPSYEVAILLACAFVGAFIHVNLVRHSMPVFTPGESDLYIYGATGMVADNAATDATPLHPGYPAFLSSVAGWTSWDLSNHTIVQALLFCLSVILIGLSCVRLIPGYILGPCMFFALMSPPAIWASRHIGMESILSTSWIASIAAFIFFWQRDGWGRWPAMIVFSIFALTATSVSPAGMVLFSLPAGLLIGTIWWTVSIRGSEFWGMAVLWKSFSQAFVPFLLLAAGSVFFQIISPSSQFICALPSPSASAPYASGMFEVGALAGQPAYAEVINERAANGYSFAGPSFSSHLEVSEASYAQLPLRAKLVAWGRLAGWGLFLPDVNTYSQKPLIRDYKILTKFRNDAEAERIRDSLKGIMRETGLVVHVMEKWSNKQIVAYNDSILPVYKWFYRILLLTALAGWMIGLTERKYLAAILVLPFLLKVLIHILTLNVTSENIQSLDTCLWLGALAGMLCVSSKAMQKPTDESDRRCMPPIRPKKLMTRHKDVPGTQGLPLDS
jgi:hypothetical protein